MTALVLVTFDIHDADSDDYSYVTEQLELIGLIKKITGDNDYYTDLPNNTYSSEVAAPKDNKEYAKEIRTKVKDIISSRGKGSKVYVLVAPSSWAWAAH